MLPNTLFCSLFLAPPHGEGGGRFGGKMAVFDFGSEKQEVKSRTELGFNLAYLLFAIIIALYSPSLCFSGWVGCFVSPFGHLHDLQTSGALIALFSVMPYFGRFQSRWGLRGPTSLHISFFFCVGTFSVTWGPERPTSLNPSPCVCLFDFYLWTFVEVRWPFLIFLATSPHLAASPCWFALFLWLDDNFKAFSVFLWW